MYKGYLQKITVSCIISIMCFILSENLQAQYAIPTAQQQIEAALAAAPTNLRQKAKVYGYSQQGEWMVLQNGSNKLICIADDPQKLNFHVSCYYKGLEPFMKRGRELRTQGHTRMEVNKIRRKEIKSGKLSFPRKPMALYSLSGKEGAYNYETGKVVKATPLYVVYVPFGTRKSTGIATSPQAPGAPWLMEAGLPEAHIMYPGEPIGTAVDPKTEGK